MLTQEEDEPEGPTGALWCHLNSRGEFLLIQEKILLLQQLGDPEKDKDWSNGADK